ncbi:hypothetical protein NHQ30_007426 [Ciborinia camelliae]|nr:hypothetical protein NHQ30_007426 [Ciborinia camelliae]
MKSFATLTAAVAALAGITSAQVTFNSTTGTFSCPIANGAYCASSSLEGPIIIRCTNGIGQPGNCDDNLAGFFPFGVNYSPCWETSDKSGDAACSKNCIVQGSSGNFNGTFTLPDCTPIPNPSSTSSLNGSTTITSTATTTQVIGSITEVITFTTTFCPTNTSTPVIPPPITPPELSATPAIPPLITSAIVPSGVVTILSSGTAVGTGGSGGGPGGSGSGGSGVHNGTTGGSVSGGSATATPVGPSKTATGTGAPEYTGAANALSAGGLAAVGAVFAWFL